MEFQIGDTVQFIDEIGKGKVIEIIDKNKVLIEDEYGFSYPVDVSGLMLDAAKNVSVVSSETDDAQEFPIEKAKTKMDFWKPLRRKKSQFSAIDLILALVPLSQDILNAEMDLFFINDSNYNVLFQCSANIDMHFQKIFSGELEANTQIHLTRLKRPVLSQIESFLFQGLIVLDEFQKPFPLIDKPVKLKHSRFQKPDAFKVSDYFDGKTIEYSIFHSDFFIESTKILDSEIEEQVTIKNEVETKKQYTRQRDKDLMEIDLHIYEIIDNVTGLSNSEMLNIQLNHFQKELEHAMVNSVDRIVFIHGKGKGVLKSALLEKLRKEYPHLKYQDASFQKYGFGATMIFLK